MAWNWRMPQEINALFDSIHNPVLAIDDKGTLVLCNRAAEKIIGKPREEFFGEPIQSIITTSQLYRILETGENELIRKIEISGSVYMSNRSPVMIGDEVVGAVAVLQDISELEAISTELEHVKRISEELDAIIESSFDGIYVTTGDAVTIRVNSSYERVTGIRREEVLGRTMNELVDDGFFNESVTLKVLKTGRTESLVQRIKTGKTVMVTGVPILDQDNKISLVVTSVRDVTELHLLQQKLETMDKLQAEQEIELRELRETVHGRSNLVIRSKKMKEIQQLALRLAHVESTVLIQGESGVGKEVFAELVHRNGPRRTRPLIKISCAAIPEQLLESELFGYAPGAFTGAKKEGKAGLIEAADGGTLFLDEIGEMPLGLQVKLLRVLQERELIRVGDVSPTNVDVRIMAATNRNLKEMVDQRLFRKDLYFRLNVVRVVIPPLRDRKEALIPFVYNFLDKYNRKYGMSKQIEGEVLSRMMEYEWPGNVRELENIVEQMVVVTQGEIITPDHLPEMMKSSGRLLDDLDGWERPLKAILEEVEKRAVESAVKKYKSTRKAAAVLGINQSTVVRKMNRYGIKPAR